MARALTAGMITELTANTCRPAFFFEAVFESFTLRIWNGVGDISWNSQTWLGNGWFRGFSGARESDDFSRNNLEVHLSGVPDTVLALILAGSKQGAPGKLWLGMLNASRQVIADPYLVYEGKLDIPMLDEGAEDTEVTLTFENEFTSVNRSTDFRWESESQKIFYPTDKGFEYVTATQEWTGHWGPKKQKPREKKNKKKNTRKRK